ncbi:TM2 domain-containing protein [Methylobacter sp. Wu8]|uniref:TM2 domain-containing membrane protein YozV n=1 Tax=Methylobacter tundripaludum TaxID=173365 RepID=A0A2S6GU13_9GAMM|nr:TM2 domain-containing protein [Methylobacter tundripaludum]MCF7966129.1 TM2 domain-containing protein [Methylobacter tundripaludum]PPK68611.1 TM2 domain-containing membrane protein YozV [Methylobacter tundripaludum]
MIGQIESYDPDKQTGVIKNEGGLFTFHLEDWVADVPPDEGDDVNFDADGTIASNINLVGAYLEPPKAVKYKYLAAVLGIVFGWTGVHRFYLGFYRLGFAQLMLTVVLYVTGLPGFAALWGFLEGALLFGGHINKDAKGRPLK